MCKSYTRVMTEEKTRVDFNAPVSLVEQADAVADLLGVSRTQLLIEAIRDELTELATDDDFRRVIADAYYSEELDFDTVESILGTEEAMRMRLLRASLDREPPEPQLAADVPPAADFYDGEVPEWTPGGDANEDETESHT